MLIAALRIALLLVVLFGCRSPSETSDEQLYNTLTGAVSRDDLAGVLELLQDGVDPNEVDANGSVPLVIASLDASPSVVSALLAAGADPNQAARDFAFTPLMGAATRVDAEGSEVVSALVASGADPCVVAPEEPSPTRFDNRFEGLAPLDIAETVGNEQSVTVIARAARCEG